MCREMDGNEGSNAFGIVACNYWIDPSPYCIYWVVILVSPEVESDT